MKKYDVRDLEDAMKIFDTFKTVFVEGKNPVIDDFRKQLNAEHKKRSAPKFIKATDAYLKKLKREDVYIRYLKEDDEHYYPGMQGLFEKKGNKLLRRHTDTGFLSLPQ
jgi:hypothetical protein